MKPNIPNKINPYRENGFRPVKAPVSVKGKEKSTRITGRKDLRTK